MKKLKDEKKNEEVKRIKKKKKREEWKRRIMEGKRRKRKINEKWKERMMAEEGKKAGRKIKKNRINCRRGRSDENNPKRRNTARLNC